MKARIGLLLIMMVAGCSALSQRGRMVVVQVNVPAGCERLQDIEHRTICMGRREVGQLGTESAVEGCRKTAEDDLRNQAGDLGANLIVMASRALQPSGEYLATARSYRCPQFTDPRLLPDAATEVRVVADASAVSGCRRVGEVSATTGGSSASERAERLLAKLRDQVFGAGANTLLREGNASSGVAYLCAVAGALPIPPDTQTQTAGEARSSGRAAASPIRAESKAGVGVAFGNGWTASTNLQFTGLHLPLHFGATRLEPSVLVQRWNGELALQVDLGLYKQAASGSTLFYGGVRGGIRHTRAGGAGETGFRVGPGLGAEHFLADSWSLGFEAALLYLRVQSTDNLDLEGRLVLRAYWN